MMEKIISGTQIQYFFLCHRKLWLFSHHLQMEQESDQVKVGKLIHESSYQREHKEIEIDSIKIDWLDLKNGILHEVKKSDSFEEAHEWQVLYYLYFLKSSKDLKIDRFEYSKIEKPNGSKIINDEPDLNHENIIKDNFELTGEIDYPKLKKKVTVILTEEKEKQLKEILINIENLISLSQPPPVDVKFSLCRKCSYLELCHA
jgi:CRISPR-associated exonuclease Cas4